MKNEREARAETRRATLPARHPNRSAGAWHFPRMWPRFNYRETRTPKKGGSR
jgi:hypothetical protein